MKRDIHNFGAWLIHKGNTEGTARQYTKVLQQALGCDKLLDVLNPRLGQSTLVTRKAALKRWAAFTHDDGLKTALASSAVCAVVKRGVAAQSDVQPLTDEQYNDFMECLDARPLHDADWRVLRPIIKLIAILGLRAGQDALSLRRSDLVEALDKGKGRFLVTVKGGHQRWLPLDPVRDEIGALVALKGWDTTADLVLKDGSSTARYNKVYRAIREVAADAGIEGMHPHRLRHTAAMRLYGRSGHDIVLVQTLLGHRNITTTQRYLSGDRLDELGSMLGPKEVPE